MLSHYRNVKHYFFVTRAGGLDKGRFLHSGPSNVNFAQPCPPFPAKSECADPVNQQRRPIGQHDRPIGAHLYKSDLNGLELYITISIKAPCRQHLKTIPLFPL